MTTTNLFVELIVIGAGTILGSILLVMSLFGYTWLPLEKIISSSTLLIPLLSFTYVLGIFMDKLADNLYSNWDKHLRKSNGFPDNAKYHIARTYIYTYATDKIINLFEYGKSRVRISRAWSINFIILAISVPVFFWTRFPQIASSTRLLLIVFSFVVFGFGAFMSFSTWKKLTINDYKRLEETYNFLMEEKRKAKITN
jgi:hypothetical protein